MFRCIICSFSIMISGILINYITAIAGPHPVDLVITKESTIRDNFTVTDVNGNIVFTVQSSLITFVTPCQHLFLLDAYENPLCIYAERLVHQLFLSLFFSSSFPVNLLYFPLIIDAIKFDNLFLKSDYILLFELISSFVCSSCFILSY